MPARTTISKRHAIAIACLGTVLIFSLRQWQATSPGNPKDQGVRHGTVLANELSAASTGQVGPIRTKSRIRSNHPQPTIEQTTELVQTTIIPVLILPPDQ